MTKIKSEFSIESDDIELQQVQTTVDIGDGDDLLEIWQELIEDEDNNVCDLKVISDDDEEGTAPDAADVQPKISIDPPSAPADTPKQVGPPPLKHMTTAEGHIQITSSRDIQPHINAV